MTRTPAQQAITVVAVIVVGALLIGAAVAWTSIDEGTVGVEKNKGAVSGEIYEPGWHLINPVSQSVVEIDTRPQTETMAGDSRIPLLTGDGQDVTMELSVRYRVEPENADQFHSEYRNHDQALSEVIVPTVRSNARHEASDLSAKEIITKDGRTALEDSVEESLNENTKGTGITIEAVQVRDVKLNEEYGAALENVEIENTKAEQRIIQAESVAEANEIREESLTNPVLTEKYIDSIDKSDTVILATGEDGQPVIMDLEAGTSTPVSEADAGTAAGNESAEGNESKGDDEEKKESEEKKEEK